MGSRVVTLIRRAFGARGTVSALHLTGWWCGTSEQSGSGSGRDAREEKHVEVRNVQDLFGEPVVSGRYSGEPISVPMAGVRPPPPFGMPTSRAPMTGPDFDVFLLTRVAP